MLERAPISRRHILASAGFLMTAPLSSIERNVNRDWCASHNSDAQPLTEPDGEPSFVIHGNKEVNVYWQPQSYFDDWGYPFAVAGAVIGGSRIVLNSDKQSQIDDYTILHELAHTLGYRHGDGGIVNPDIARDSNNGDRDGDSLNDVTVDVAESYDEYLHISDWNASALGKIVIEFGKDEIPASQLGTAVTRYGSSSSIDDVYIKSSYDGFGGQFESGYQPQSDNVYMGRFYKSN